MAQNISLKQALDLTDKQKVCLRALRDDTTTEILFGGGAGGGKSIIGCVWLILMCLKYPGTRWVMGRAKLKNLIETTLNSFFWVAPKFGLESNTDYNYNSQRGLIKFPNGSEILLKDLFLYPSDPNFDSLGSLEITGAFVDECNQVTLKAWEILKSRIRYRLDEFGLLPKLLGSCNPAKNWVYTRYYKPSLDGSLPVNYKFVQALVTDNKHISQHYINNLLSLSDKNDLERLFHGNWEYSDDKSILMGFDAILGLFTSERAVLGDMFISADIARFGADKTVVMVWNGYRMIDMISLDKSSITQSAELIKRLALKHNVPTSNIIADENGLGSGVVDILGCQGFLNNGRALDGENYANLKSQCYYKLGDMVNAGEIHLTVNTPLEKEMIIQELEQIKQYKMDTDGKKSVTPKDQIKEDIKRSPDYADCLMMRMFFCLSKYEFYVN